MPNPHVDPIVVAAPMTGTVIALPVAEGDAVAARQPLVVLESMKMEHPVLAEVGGRVGRVHVAEGETVSEGAPLVDLLVDQAAAATDAAEADIDLEAIRADLAGLFERLRYGLDEARPEAVAKRHARGQRTARENVADLLDDGSFVEIGGLAIAAQRRRRPEEELIRATPADGMVAGYGTVNRAQFPPSAARCVVVAYDYTVLAGTQGMANHKKLDRLLGQASRWRVPIVVFAEGGGGRPGDTDWAGVAALDIPSFRSFAALSGRVPLVGIVSGRCFAGNAALLGCCDVVIATRSSSIGMGGPAMIEGGGLGMVDPDEVGPSDVQYGNGVIDVLVDDEAAAVDVARRYLSYFQGDLAPAGCADQRLLRHLIPENRLRSYDVRQVIEALADAGSVLELRAGFGAGIVTALVRIEGRPFGLLANNSRHLGGAIDAPAADKAARFLQLCDAHGLPVVSLCDTPGFMVGPEAERTATVRHFARLFVVAAAMRVPMFTLVLRKGYGLGAQAMAGGSFHAPVFTVAWPTGEFGAMGLEGAVRLGFRRELEAIEDPAERDRMMRSMVELAYQHGKAINTASYLEIDAVIDPAETRHWLLRGLETVPPLTSRSGWRGDVADGGVGGSGGHGFVDTW